MRRDVHEIRPASVDQVVEGQDGTIYVVEDDVGNVVADLQRIDPRFRVRLLERGRCYVLTLLEERPDGRTHEHFVSSVEFDCFDQRVVREAERYTHESYDLWGEMEANRQRHERERRADLAERVGETADEAVYLIRREFGVKDRICVP